MTIFCCSLACFMVSVLTWVFLIFLRQGSDSRRAVLLYQDSEEKIDALNREVTELRTRCEDVVSFFKTTLELIKNSEDRERKESVVVGFEKPKKIDGRSKEARALKNKNKEIVNEKPESQ